jgi:oligoribonuclease NrnB/cAMP/cGMP phosphodiesterase (DHH superfamily)
MSEVIVIYHDDLDGRCAGSLLADLYPKAIYIPIDYHYASPLGKIKQGDCVFIVDYSFSDTRDMLAVMEKTKNLVWFDHHKTTLEKYNSGTFKDIPGTRVVGKSGALLVWEYIHPDDDPPMYVQLINDYDLWMLKDEDTVHFANGLLLHDTTPQAKIWRMLKEDDPAFMQHILNLGEVIGAFKEQHYAEYIRRYGYGRKYADYKCIIINTAKTTTKAFESVKFDYDIFVSYAYNGDRYVVSLYAANHEIDVADIAKRFGGGGHRGASGFTCRTLPEWMK